MFSGSIVALVTPFSNGEVDYKKLEFLTDFHLGNGTKGFVPAGTTGESPTLSEDERFNVIKTVVKIVKGRVPVIAGSGTSSTKKTIENVKSAKEAGANGVLIVTPYYNKPTQEGLYRHFEAVSKVNDLPIVIYNVPARTGVNILPETVKRLSGLEGVVSIKECSGSLDQLSQIKLLCNIGILSGEDSLTFPSIMLGAKGVISAAANIIPGPMSKMCDAALAGNYEEARKIHFEYTWLFKALFMETNPIPVKTALKHMGMINGELRLPLCPMAAANEEKLLATMKECGLIS